jgi:hypothetical protein
VEEEGKSKFNLGKIAQVLIVLVLAFLAVKFLVGLVYVVIKWVAIGVAALFITWLVFRKSGADR